jgi:hypothetical protein
MSVVLIARMAAFSCEKADRRGECRLAAQGSGEAGQPT